MNETTEKNMGAGRDHLVIGWLYPELMSTYGDQGNGFAVGADYEDGFQLPVFFRHSPNKIFPDPQSNLPRPSGSPARAEKAGEKIQHLCRKNRKKYASLVRAFLSLHTANYIYQP